MRAGGRFLAWSLRRLRVGTPWRRRRGLCVGAIRLRRQVQALKGKRRKAAPRSTLADAVAHEQTCDSLRTRIAPLKDDIQSGIAHPCRDGA